MMIILITAKMSLIWFNIQSKIFSKFRKHFGQDQNFYLVNSFGYYLEKKESGE